MSESNNANLNWLVARFAREVPGVSHAVLVSADGLLQATSDNLPEERAEQLAAITAGLASLATGAVQLFDGGKVMQSIVDMQRGYLLVMSVGTASHLAVLATKQHDIGRIGYEMALLVDRVGTVIQATARSTV
ncbi:roadblock/LC7 domain-containing protein [Nocardia goodfellowii]|uniref:Regulator of Ras-like GTPase activity (Roadblock/LC7/MglB family) n=1 Tax=Nocardia goodfellowii TaxID=882446 RepID=A0ABS4QBD6_9NOCA|nr:roadblock/LC7 domain-containing protein [Nocardia goodfellowii]MBP2189006.1 putative regulator of Ras-like GTPase activity (Roadblock/LC7/MglB family) [Nocardia goodfellowii]